MKPASNSARILSLVGVVLPLLCLVGASASEPRSKGREDVALEKENAAIGERLQIRNKLFELELLLKRRSHSDKLLIQSLEGSRRRAKGIMTERMYLELGVGLEVLTEVCDLQGEQRVGLLKLHRSLAGNLQSPLELAIGRLETSQVESLLNAFPEDDRSVKSEKENAGVQVSSFREKFLKLIGVSLSQISEDLKVNLEREFRNAHADATKIKGRVAAKASVLTKLQPQTLERLQEIISKIQD